MRILIAEDDVTSRRILEVVLDKWGYGVTSATDGDEAWQLIQEADSPDLLVLDWMMPGKSGVELCELVRKMDRQQRKYIILLTALTSSENIVEGLQAGADDYVTKPFNQDELRVRLEAGRRIVQLQGDLVDQIRELRAALDHVERLQGLLPICMQCKKIRDEDEIWQRLEDYISEYTDIRLSHGLCPECARAYYSELEQLEGRDEAKKAQAEKAKSSH